MKKRYWALIVAILIVLSVAAGLFFDGVEKSNADSQQAWTKLKPQLQEYYNLTSQGFPSTVDSKIFISDFEVFLSILGSSQHDLLFYTNDGGSMLLWFPYEGLVYGHYVHGIDIGVFETE